MERPRARRALTGLGFLFSVHGPALAHGPDPHRLLLEVEGSVVRATLTPGVDALGAFDSDRDGTLDRGEVGAARARLRAFVSERFALSDLQGSAAVCEPASVSTVGDGAPYVRVSLRCVFSARPDALVVRYALAESGERTVEAVRIERVSDRAWVPEGGVDRRVLPPEGGVVVVLQEATCAS